MPWQWISPGRPRLRLGGLEVWAWQAWPCAPAASCDRRRCWAAALPVLRQCVEIYPYAAAGLVIGSRGGGIGVGVMDECLLGACTHCGFRIYNQSTTVTARSVAGTGPWSLTPCGS